MWNSAHLLLSVVAIFFYVEVFSKEERDTRRDCLEMRRAREEPFPISLSCGLPAAAAALQTINSNGMNECDHEFLPFIRLKVSDRNHGAIT